MSNEVTINDIVENYAAKNAPTNESGNPAPSSTTNTEEVKKDEVSQVDTSTPVVTDVVPRETPLFSDEELKEFGFESKDALKEFLKKQKEPQVSPEEQKRREDVYKVDLQKYAVENGRLSPEDFLKLENFKSKADRDLVYESFVEEFKKENPSASESEIKESFEEEYPSYDEQDEDEGDRNKVRNAKVAKRLAKEAGMIKKPIESSFTKAKEDFDAYVSSKEIFPKYVESIKSAINKVLTDKIPFYSGKDGEESVSIELNLSKEDKQEIANAVEQKVQSVSSFDSFKKGNKETIETLVKEAIEAHLWSPKYRELGMKQMAETFLNRGIKKGSDVGAENPFPVNKINSQATASKEDAKAQVLRSIMGED